jgi:hypothetical protein
VVVVVVVAACNVAGMCLGLACLHYVDTYSPFTSKALLFYLAYDDSFAPAKVQHANVQTLPNSNPSHLCITATKSCITARQTKHGLD